MVRAAVLARVFSFRAPHFLVPHVRQIRTDEHEVAGAQARDVVADHPMPAALQHERELILGVKMPRRVVARAAHDFAVEGFPLRARSFFEDGFHGWTQGWGREGKKALSSFSA